MGNWGTARYKFIFPDGLHKDMPFEELGDLVEGLCSSLSNSSMYEGTIDRGMISDDATSFKLECWTLDIKFEENLSRDYFDKELRKLFPLEAQQKLDEEDSCIYDFCKRYKCFCDKQSASEATCYSTIRTFIGPDGSILYENGDDEEKEPKWEDLVAENYAKMHIGSVLDGN